MPQLDLGQGARAVDDGATVPVFYESRLIPLNLPAGMDPEALRSLVEQEMRNVTRHNVVVQTSFSERLAELMRQYGATELVPSFESLRSHRAAVEARGL